MTTHPCEYCDAEVYSVEGQASHNKLYPRYCAQHNVCMTSWHGHIKTQEHTQCTVLGCPSMPRFNSNAEFLRHFNVMHAGEDKVYETVDVDDEYAGYESDYAKK